MSENKTSFYKWLVMGIGVGCVPEVQAHHVMEGASFTNGATFPIHGIDHIVAMIAVGLWAAWQESRRCRAILAGFAVALVIGGGLGALGPGSRLMESGVALSVAALGLVMAFAFRGPVWAMMGVAGLFAIAHGYVGGAEMPANNGLTLYLLGYLACTGLLQAAGFAVGRLLSRYEGYPVARWTGGALTIFGMMLAAGVIG